MQIILYKYKNNNQEELNLEFQENKIEEMHYLSIQFI
jgi:hypothetical protein